MSTLNVAGAKLYFDVGSDGQLLIMMPRAAATGEVFRPPVGTRAARYQVVTYDRRGFSRSPLNGAQNDDH